VSATSPELEARYARLQAELRQLQVKRQSAQTRETVKAQIMEEKMAALKEQIRKTAQDMADLVIAAPIAGIWVAPDIERIPGKYLSRGQRIGVVAGLDALRIRAVAGQTVAARLIREAEPVVAIRVKGRPDIEMAGRIDTVIPAGQQRLPTAALGYTAGGATRIDVKDPSGRQTAEPFFEIVVRPAFAGAERVLPGQTMVLRFETVPKPLCVQIWRSLQQVFQKRFEV
jgi:putative peptide zinc metalloprotease protein